MFFLNCPGGPPELRASYGFNLREVNRVEQALALVVVLATLRKEWRSIYGRY